MLLRGTAFAPNNAWKMIIWREILLVSYTIRIPNWLNDIMFSRSMWKTRSSRIQWLSGTTFCLDLRPSIRASAYLSWSYITYNVFLQRYQMFPFRNQIADLCALVKLGEDCRGSKHGSHLRMLSHHQTPHNSYCNICCAELNSRKRYGAEILFFFFIILSFYY